MARKRSPSAIRECPPVADVLNVPPAAIRERSPWDIFTLLVRPNQVSNPASMNADAALGFSATGYQYADIALGNFEATSGILQLLDGNASKGHTAPKSQALVQRAKVGCYALVNG